MTGQEVETKRGHIQVSYKEEIVYHEGGETLEWVSQKGDRCLIPENIQGHVGQGSEKSDIVEGDPVNCRGVEGGGL